MVLPERPYQELQNELPLDVTRVWVQILFMTCCLSRPYLDPDQERSRDLDPEDFKTCQGRAHLKNVDKNVLLTLQKSFQNLLSSNFAAAL